MSTAFQTRKLTYFFHILDLNSDSFIQLEDFSEMAEKVRVIMGYDDGGKEHKRITDKATKLYHTLVSVIDPNDKQQISKEEWLNYFENEVILSEELLDEYKEMIFNFMFDFFDQNRDGFISRKEYRDFYEIFGIDTAYVDMAFQKLDNTNSYKLSRYDLMTAVEDFFGSDDKEIAGNWVFGNWESVPHSA